MKLKSFYLKKINMSRILKARKIRRLSKTQLCILFDCISQNGEIDSRKLKREYLTQDYITKSLKTTEKAYNNIKIFSIEDTKTIIKDFQITDEELNQFL